tara:strand:+ start:89 stop:1075 length:987 start_codon:yes stop_codon:yes gene_type:complete
MQSSTLYNKVLDKLIPSSHWCSQRLKDLCHTDTDFLEHTLEQQDDFIHFLCLVHLYVTDNSEYKRLSNADLAALIRTHPKKQILKELITPYPSGITNILKKLNNRPYSKHIYHELITLLQDTKARNFLQHASSINPNTIKCLYQLDHHWRDIKLLRHVKFSKDVSTVLFIHRACIKIRNKYPGFIDHSSLHQIEGIDGLVEWFIRRINKIQFQTPPWLGNKNIRPITNGTQLIQESKAFKNCISDYLPDALLGTCYFFTSDYGPAIIKLNKIPLFEWQIDEILGAENTLLSTHVLNKIYNEFSMNGIEKKTDIDFDQPILNRLTNSWI